MRHIVVAVAMLVIALVSTFVAAAVLQDVAVARNNVQSDTFEVTAKPWMPNPIKRGQTTAAASHGQPY